MLRVELAEGGPADVGDVVPGPARKGRSPPRRASRVTVGCEARGTSTGWRSGVGYPAARRRAGWPRSRRSRPPGLSGWPGPGLGCNGGRPTARAGTFPRRSRCRWLPGTSGRAGRSHRCRATAFAPRVCLPGQLPQPAHEPPHVRGDAGTLDTGGTEVRYLLLARSRLGWHRRATTACAPGPAGVIQAGGDPARGRGWKGSTGIPAAL